MEKVSMSHEDYLEAIVMLGGTTENSVRSVDIANKLGVSKASVNKAMNALKEKGFADQPYYGDVTLTEAGYRYGATSPSRNGILISSSLTSSVPIFAPYFSCDSIGAVQRVKDRANHHEAPAVFPRAGASFVWYPAKSFLHYTHSYQTTMH